MPTMIVETAPPERVYSKVFERYKYYPVGALLCDGCKTLQPVSGSQPAVELREMAHGGKPCGTLCYDCFRSHQGPFTGDPDVPGALRYAFVTAERKVRFLEQEPL